MNDRNRGPWIQTLTGGAWYPFDPRPEDVRFEDLRALSRINRFGGHTICDGYSVAEHSVRVALRVEQLGGNRLTCLAALLHDAHEAYPPGDQLGPFLRGCERGPWHQMLGEFDGFLRVVGQAERTVREVFGVGSPFAHPEIEALIKRADYELLATERRDLMEADGVDWGKLPAPLAEKIAPMSPAVAWDAFEAGFYFFGGQAR